MLAWDVRTTVVYNHGSHYDYTRQNAKCQPLESKPGSLDRHRTHKPQFSNIAHREQWLCTGSRVSQDRAPQPFPRNQESRTASIYRNAERKRRGRAREAKKWGRDTAYIWFCQDTCTPNDLSYFIPDANDAYGGGRRELLLRKHVRPVSKSPRPGEKRTGGEWCMRKWVAFWGISAFERWADELVPLSI